MLRRIHPRGTAGGALVFVLITVLMVAALAASFLQVNSAVTRRQAGAVDLKEAFYMAEAGLTESFAGLTIGKTGNVGTEEAPAVFGSGLFWVSSEDLGNDLVRLDATGLSGTGRAKLSSVVRRGSVSVASLGVFAAEELAVLPGSLIDGYNSAEAEYDEQTTEDLATFSGGRLSSNGPVGVSGTQEQPTTIHGDVTAGPAHTVSTSSHVTITGEVQSLYVASSLPPVSVPEIALASGISHDEELPLLIQPGTTGLASLRVGSNAEVQILGPAQLRVGTLRVAPLGRLVLDNAAGPIRIYVDDELALAEGSAIQVTAPDPASVSVLIAGASAQPLLLAAEGAFYGVVYAPAAEVELGSPFEVFGALVARRLTMLGPVQLHFDHHLLAAASETALPSLVSWRILELGQLPGVPPGGSPFQALGLDPELLPPPSAAHEDQYLKISYLDATDTFASWEGMESTFDWSDVAEPLTVQRSGNQVPNFEEPGTVAPEVPAPDPVLQALLDAISDPGLDASEIRQFLLDEAPVPEQALLAAFCRTPPMGSSGLRDVLQASFPLSQATLQGMLDSSPMSTGDIGLILGGSSPLSGSLLDALVGAASLDSQELRDVLILNSPLPSSVVPLLALRVPPMDPSDLLAVLAAQ